MHREVSTAVSLLQSQAAAGELSSRAAAEGGKSLTGACTGNKISLPKSNLCWFPTTDVRCLSPLDITGTVMCTWCECAHPGLWSLVWETASPLRRCDKTLQPSAFPVSSRVIALSSVRGFPWLRSRGSPWYQSSVLMCFCKAAESCRAKEAASWSKSRWIQKYVHLGECLCLISRGNLQVAQWVVSLCLLAYWNHFKGTGEPTHLTSVFEGSFLHSRMN